MYRRYKAAAGETPRSIIMILIIFSLLEGMTRMYSRVNAGENHSSFKYSEKLGEEFKDKKFERNKK